MARVRLRVDDTDPPNAPITLVFDPRDGTTERLPILRLMTTVLVGPDPRPGDVPDRPELGALVDTGAWLTVVKKDTWEDLDEQGFVEHLERRAADGSPVEGNVRLGGQRLRFTLGRIWMAVSDDGLTLPGGYRRRPVRLPAVPVLCQLLQDSETVLKAPVLLGLHLGVLDGRQLRRVPVPAVPTPEVARTDVGPRYGQQWWLQDEE